MPSVGKFLRRDSQMTASSKQCSGQRRLSVVMVNSLLQIQDLKTAPSTQARIEDMLCPDCRCHVTSEGFAQMTAKLKQVAPLAVLLEGGYSDTATVKATEALP